jgi:hypothetical protein
MTYQTFILPEGMSINNRYFNEEIQHNDELSLDVKPITYGRVPHDKDTWVVLKSEEQLDLYDSKHLLHFAAVEFMIDDTDKTHSIISKDTMESGRLLSKKEKREMLEKKKLEAKKAAALAATNKPDVTKSS